MFGQDDNQQDNLLPATGVNEDNATDTTATPLVTQTASTDSEEHKDDTTTTHSDDSSNPTSSAPSVPAIDDLLTMKQQALQQLAPLVDHLDQSPEEKFRTTMMMIQAADDQTLLKSAYETAKLITDEKNRAQALLDVVNEINYFTQQHNHSS